MKILYFAWLKEKTGVSEEDIHLPDGVTDVAGLVAWMKGRGPGFAEAFTDEAVVRCAVNQDHVDGAHPVTDRDEVAFFPPVTGG
ncbi:MAG: molybdopterin converting factor subunit 1 [Alphaproteobacteria bacterium]|nr:molybdopterin converting factor subunit 1 [Alphaproteobacteria bacterium]